MGLTREVGDTLLIRGYLSKDLKEVREQPQGDPGYGNGGVAMFQVEGLDSAGSPWGSGSAWGGYNEEVLVSGARGRVMGVRRVGRQGVREPGGHWRVCSVELMTDRHRGYQSNPPAGLSQRLWRGWGGVGWGRVDGVAGRPVLSWLW